MILLYVTPILAFCSIGNSLSGAQFRARVIGSCQNCKKFDKLVNMPYFCLVVVWLHKHMLNKATAGEPLWILDIHFASHHGLIKG